MGGGMQPGPSRVAGTNGGVDGVASGTGSSGGGGKGWLIAAFAAVYVIWGSTYLAIRYAIETLPPFLMAAVRFLVAGSVLYAWARWRGAERPGTTHWRAAFIAGGLLLAGGNGALVWAEQRVASGVAALLVATVPLWMVMLHWMLEDGGRPTGRVVAGLGLGLAGIGVLVGPGALLGGGRIDPVGAGALVLGSLSWAAGSLYARTAPLPTRPRLGTGMEMLAGAALLVLAGVATGEVARLDPGGVTLRSAAGLVYLIVFGSLIAFSAYVYMLREASPARVATYAYVNPVVAVLLGWGLAGEPLTARTLAASVIIIGAVVLITLGPRRA